MDVDFWTSRFQSAKTYLIPARGFWPNNSGSHFILEDSENCITCPFCDVDIEVPSLCAHLQEEHCFDVGNAVCPVCAANLGKDVIEHFTMLHAHLLKRRKTQKAGLWTNSSTILSKELRELSSYIGPTSCRGKDSAPDPLLSPFICSVPSAKHEGKREDVCCSNIASADFDMKRNQSVFDEGNKEEYEERMQRAMFCQQLVVSAIF